MREGDEQHEQSGLGLQRRDPDRASDLERHPEHRDERLDERLDDRRAPPVAGERAGLSAARARRGRVTVDAQPMAAVTTMLTRQKAGLWVMPIWVKSPIRVGSRKAR